MKVTLHHRLFTHYLSGIFVLAWIGYYPVYAAAQAVVPVEICDNAIDDDNDGLIDLNDPDCHCDVIAPTSLIPNPSFEDMDCCPSSQSQMDCASAWIQASEATTDYIHTCDWLGWPDFPAPMPFPDGQGIMGFRDGRVRQGDFPEPYWKEYAGACLLSPLKANNAYRFEFDVGFVNNTKSPPINISFFGTTNCANLPFGIGNNAFGCPSNDPNWVRLGSKLVSGGAGNKWVKTSIDVVPNVDITAIAIGPDCPPVESDVSIYYFFDNLILADFNSFELKVKTVSHPCQSDFRLKILEDSSYAYQWYKDGIALVGETFSQLTEIYGEGDYQVRIMDGTDCRVSEHFQYAIPVYTSLADITLCKDETLLFGNNLLSETGTYVDTFQTENNCDSIVTLNLKVLGALSDTVSAWIFKGETYQLENYRITAAGEHLLQFTSALGCDSLVLLQLDYYNLYIPNVFSPNGDGLNDEFEVFGQDNFLEFSEQIIFDRWGNEVYRGEEWDGKFKGKYVNPGVYTYLVYVVMDDGIKRRFSGSVTVVR